MILTVTLNAAIDKTLIVPDFARGCVNRPVGAIDVAGGKGLNVARVLKTLGEPVLATGLLAGNTGTHIAALLDAEGIAHDFERLPTGESRTCVALVHPEGPPHTEVNENGPLVSASAFEAFVAHYKSLLPAADWVALSGSLPLGLDAGAYLRLLALARAAGKPVSVDTSGPELPAVLAGAPELVKPNQPEMELAIGRPVTLATLFEAIRALQTKGPKQVAVTLGALGAAIADAETAWWVAAPEVPIVNPIGSGDSFLAALLVMQRRGASLAEALRWAVAAGSANAAVPGAAAPTLAQIEALVPRTEAVPLSEAMAPLVKS